MRLALLMLLASDGAANGYQLMQGLEQRSQGEWRPSPGSVYPALAQLEDEGLIRSVTKDDETGRTFELTDAGRSHLDQHAPDRAPWEPDESGADEPRIALRGAMFGLGKAAWNVAIDGDAGQVQAAVDVLEDARRQLYRLLAGDIETPASSADPSAPDADDAGDEA